jgi:thiol-disulfide isomerase/thioredoxin
MLLLPFAAAALLNAAAPTPSVTTLEGRQVPFSDYTGKATLVAFWGTFCGPCTEELPHVEALARKFAGKKDVRFVAVSMDPAHTPAQREKIAKMARELGLTFPVVVDPGPLAAALSADPGAPTPQGMPDRFGLPYLVVMDDQGHRHRESGYHPDRAATFEDDHAKLIQLALAHRLPKDVMDPTAQAAEATLQKGDAAAALPLYQQAYASGVRDGTFEYDAACAASRLGKTDEAFTWLARAAEDGFADAGWMKQDPDLASLQKDPRFADALKAASAQKDDQLAAEHPKNPKLQKAILALVDEDQAVRSQVQFGTKDAALFQKMKGVDARSTRFMKKTLARHGWPGKSLVGKTAAHGAWLLVQHADADHAFQARCLPLLAKAVKAGEAEGEELAYLTDRVRVAQNQKQLYGTQFRPENGKMVPSPIEDFEHLDERRRAIGLMPFAEYQQRLLKDFGAPPAAPASGPSNAPAVAPASTR